MSTTNTAGQQAERITLFVMKLLEVYKRQVALSQVQLIQARYDKLYAGLSE